MTDPVPADPVPSDRRLRRLSPLTPLVRGSVLVVAVAASSWDDLLRGEIGPVALILLGLLVAGAVYGAASWARTTYWIEADELRVDTGVVSRQSRRIRVDRLQGIDIVQPFVARLFGLAEMRMDVAGGSSDEGSLAYLPLAEANALRDTLLARRDAVREARRQPGDDPAAGSRLPTRAERADQPERVVASLDLPMLVVSLLLSGQTVAFALTAVLVVGASVMFGQFAGAVGVLPVLVGFAFAQVRRLSAYYGFTVAETAPGSRCGAGSSSAARRPSPSPGCRASSSPSR